jgi:poly-beta-1,6-N-acetyl-D-glucosamine synthase
MVLKQRFAIITPARNEERHMGRMIESVMRQTMLPEEFIIVDDGSSDKTPDIIDSYARNNPRIRKIILPDRGHRLPGGESAIQIGFDEVRWDCIEVLARMDADLSFGDNFFETLLEKFDHDSRLGITAGVIYEHSNDGWHNQKLPNYHTRGACKLYRRECFEQIKPIGTKLGWDGQDEARANYYGWTTRSYEDVPIYHHRETGGSVGRLKFCRNMGLAAYYIGYHPVFQILRIIVSLLRKPFFFGSLMMLTGWAEGYLRRMPREDRQEVVEYVRKQQINRLLGRKSVWK